MARPLRIELAGGYYHVMNRGNNRQDIFLTDKDRKAFVEALADRRRGGLRSLGKKGTFIPSMHCNLDTLSIDYFGWNFLRMIFFIIV